MAVAIFGESCVGKSTLAEALREQLGAKVYSGKDYLRLSQNEVEARRLFAEMLAEQGANIVYVAAEPDQLQLVPDSCLRVLMTAELSVIKERFAKRTGGKLPPPIAAMLERKHGMFDNAPRDLHLVDGAYEPESACAEIERLMRK